ncbi:MAG: fumarate reductase flavoprotein subunit, partial [Verrucomicrobia bacterium]|nr:fumarate reductase flavoprotein subunit [Verrucomicrobiota bacterium]
MIQAGPSLPPATKFMHDTKTITLKFKALLAAVMVLGMGAAVQAADTVLVEAESFKDQGGWVVDTQFIEIMGSPYLLAHGMGTPVKDAVTTVKFPSTGKYRVLVRTKDWVARWKAPGTPGKFQVIVDGEAVKETFGTKGENWFWHDGGTVEIKKTEAQVALRDLTGFEGRCDAIIFTKDAAYTPPETKETLPKWRRELMGLPGNPVESGPYDLVIVGGGYGGMGAAISAARMGIKVALIQNRPVLGGNGSSEIRVWAMGGTRRGLYPKLGGIVEEFMDKAKSSPGTFEEFGDDKKEALVRAEKNISLFLNNHVFAVETNANKLVAVIGLDTRTSQVTRFSGKLFVDSTGHATVGALAGADHTVQEEGHLGMSNMWRWEEGKEPAKFPETPWALDL